MTKVKGSVRCFDSWHDGPQVDKGAEERCDGSGWIGGNQAPLPPGGPRRCRGCENCEGDERWRDGWLLAPDGSVVDGPPLPSHNIAVVPASTYQQRIEEERIARENNDSEWANRYAQMATRAETAEQRIPELEDATREFVHAQAVLTGDPVRAKAAGDRLVELGVIGEGEPR